MEQMSILEKLKLCKVSKDDIDISSMGKQLSKTFNIDEEQAIFFYTDFKEHVEIVKQVIYHALNVLHLPYEVYTDLLLKAECHDNSKLYDDKECAEYIKLTSDLKNKKYGTPEYFDVIKNNKGIQYHYANNSHHPEHYKNGFEEMKSSAGAVIEMLCDWISAHYRKNSSFETFSDSLDFNKKRYNISDKDFEDLKLICNIILN